MLGPPGQYLDDVTISADGKRVFFTRARPGDGRVRHLVGRSETSAESPVSPGPDTEIRPAPPARWHDPDLRGAAGPLAAARTPGSRHGPGRRIAALRGFPSGRQTSRPTADRCFSVSGARRESSTSGSCRLDAKAATPKPFVQSAVQQGGRPLFARRPLRRLPLRRAAVRERSTSTAFPGPGEKVRSLAAARGGAALEPRSGELLFVSDDGHLVSVPVQTAPALQIGKPVDLFAMPDEKAVADLRRVAGRDADPGRRSGGRIPRRCRST